MKRTLKILVFTSLSVFLGIAIFCLFLEVILRFLPVNAGLHSMPVNQHTPMLRFEPNRTSIWSRFWDFSAKNTVKTNNYGFVSNLDYHPHLKSPLIAIIGDSYIEAARIPYEQTGAARLQTQLGQNVRVYAFGTSGSSLSQYLAYANYVGQEFHPNILVVLIVGNDFDESLMKYKRIPGFHYFVENEQGELVLKRIDYRVSVWRKIVRNSALAMYVTTNLNIVQALNTLKFSLKQETFVGQTKADSEPERLADSQNVVDTFLTMVPEASQLAPSHILLVVDGMRPHLYTDKDLQAAQGSYYDLMRQYVKTSARKRGFELIDMQPIFIAHYQKYGQRFEFPNDGHWNSLGHQLFADAIAQSHGVRQLSENRQ